MSRENDVQTMKKISDIFRNQRYKDKTAQQYLRDYALPALETMPVLEDYAEQDKAIWKGDDVSFFSPTVDNEVVHDFIVKAFDIAVRENMTMGYYYGEYGGNFYDEFKKYASAEEFLSWGHYAGDGCFAIARFLDSYRETKIELVKQGKTILEPETFKEFPELKDYADGVFRDRKGNIAFKIQDDGSVKFEQSYLHSLTNKEKCEILERTESRAFAVALLESGIKDVDFSRIKARLTDEDKSKFKDIKIQELSEKLAETKARLEQQERYTSEIEACLEQQKREVAEREKAIKTERASSVNIAENVKEQTDEQRKENFAAKKKLMKEHPIMLEPCLNSMCESYVATKDEAIKNEMLSDLYAIRKGGKTDSEKREMAKTFKLVLDKNPSLKKDENLVALSKIDTIVSQPTKGVKKQITR